MNYNSVILVGVVIVMGVWWAAHASRKYPGPKVMRLYIHDDSVGAIGHSTAVEKS